MTITAPQPPIGDTGWGEAVNQFFKELEEALVGLRTIGPLDVEAGSTFPDYYTKDEVNEIIAGANFSFFLSDTVDAGIGAYFQLFDADTEGIKSSVGPITIAADGTLIKKFITEIGQPTFKVLSEGVLSLDVHALTTVGANVKASQVQWKLWKRTHPGGVETLIVTSEEGPNLTDVETHYTIHATLAEEINLDVADRLVLEVYGNNSGTEPGDPDVTISMEGDTASRVSVQTTISAFDERYLQLNGAKAMTDDLDMGTKAITNVGNVDGVDVSAHKARHQSGGADAIKLDDLATPDDNTHLNASATRHGLLPKLLGVTDRALQANGTWYQPLSGPFWIALLESMSTPLYWNMLTGTPDAIGQGTWVTIYSGSYMYEGAIYNTTHNDGDNFSVAFKCLAGTYTLRFNAAKHTQFGIVDVYIDAVEKGSFDLYAAVLDREAIHEIAGIEILGGAHIIKFQIDGKNGAASDHYCNVQGIQLLRTA